MQRLSLTVLILALLVAAHLALLSLWLADMPSSAESSKPSPSSEATVALELATALPQGDDLANPEPLFYASTLNASSAPLLEEISLYDVKRDANLLTAFDLQAKLPSAESLFAQNDVPEPEQIIRTEALRVLLREFAKSPAPAAPPSPPKPDTFAQILLRDIQTGDTLAVFPLSASIDPQLAATTEAWALARFSIFRDAVGQTFVLLLQSSGSEHVDLLLTDYLTTAFEAPDFTAGLFFIEVIPA